MTEVLPNMLPYFGPPIFIFVVSVLLWYYFGEDIRAKIKKWRGKDNED